MNSVPILRSPLSRPIDERIDTDIDSEALAVSRDFSQAIHRPREEPLLQFAEFRNVFAVRDEV